MGSSTGTLSSGQERPWNLDPGISISGKGEEVEALRFRLESGKPQSMGGGYSGDSEKGERVHVRKIIQPGNSNGKEPGRVGRL